MSRISIKFASQKVGEHIPPLAIAYKPAGTTTTATKRTEKYEGTWK